MSLSASNIKVSEATKGKTSQPNFLLSLLTACSTAVPAAGKEGETALMNQLSDLLQDKTLSVIELDFLYRYTFGLGIQNALNCAMFQGSLDDFLIKQKCFCIADGMVSMLPVCMDEKVVDTKVLLDDPEVVERESLADLESHLDADDESQGPDCSKVFEDDECSLADSASTADDVDTCCEVLSQVDVPSWHCVGSRLAATLSSPSCSDDSDTSWQELSCRLAATLNAADELSLDDADAASCWKDVSSRLAQAVNRAELGGDGSNSDEQWKALSDRIAAAVRVDLESEDTGIDMQAKIDDRSLGSDVDEEINTVAWSDVSSRLLAAWKHIDC